MSAADRTAVEILLWVAAACAVGMAWGFTPPGAWRALVGTLRAALARLWLWAIEPGDPDRPCAMCAEEDAEEQSYDAACEELDRTARAEARARHPVRRLRPAAPPLTKDGAPLSLREERILAEVEMDSMAGIDEPHYPAREEQ